MTHDIVGNKAILSLARANKRYDDANPDVGMGPGNHYFIHGAALELGIDLTDNEIEELAKQL